MAENDIIDEVLDLFRANCFFRNFEIQGNADRVLIYLILFISDCLGKLTKNPPQKEALKILNGRALDHFAIPGDPTFPLNALYSAPANRGDAGLISYNISNFFFLINFLNFLHSFNLNRTIKTIFNTSSSRISKSVS